MKRKTMKRLIFIGLSASLLLFGSCEEEMVGPSIDGIAIDTFNIENSNPNVLLSADFANNDSIHFVGSWEFDAKWIITVKGMTSGATKTLKGYGKSVDESVVWDGSSDLVFFKQDEICEATLSFENYNDFKKSDNKVQVISEKEIDCIILSDYDGVEAEGWAGSEPLVENGVVLPPTQKLSFEAEGIVAPQGNYYCQMSGLETGGKYYLAGNILMINESPLQIDTVDISNNYLNFFVYGYPEYYKNSQVFVMFTDANENQIGFQDRFTIQNIGWNGISVPLSRFRETGNETGKPFDFSNITGAGYSLFSVDGTACSAKIAVDYFVITKGKPLFSLYN